LTKWKTKNRRLGNTGKSLPTFAQKEIPKTLCNMEKFIPSNIAEALGWTILHSLWQATIIGAVLMLILQLMKSNSANQRYCISLSALFAILLMAIITFFTIYQPQNQTAPLASAEEIIWLNLLAFQETEKTWEDYLSMTMSFATTYSPQISLVWLLGVVFLSIRFLFNLLYIHQLKTYKVTSASAEWEERLRAIAEKVKTNRQIKLVESALVEVPTVVGWLKPVILFPLGMFVALSPYEIESILAHELAHIRRNDFLLNILQSIVEILFFYHPAVWYIAKHIENERENCCDDIAIAVTSDSLTNIKSLTNLATFKMNTLKPALAITGKNSGSLLHRVSRIAKDANLVNRWARKNTISPKLTAAMIVIMSLLLLATKTEATTFLVERLAQTPLDFLVKPFENKGKSQKDNDLSKKEIFLADTTKKPQSISKTVTVYFDSLSDGDSTISIKTIITKNGKSDTLHNITAKNKMPFFFEFNKDNLNRSFIISDSAKVMRLENNELSFDSLGKIWLHNPNGGNKLVLINNLKLYNHFKYLPTDSIFIHLKSLKENTDFQIVNPQEFLKKNISKHTTTNSFWISADSIGKTLPKIGKTYIYPYNQIVANAWELTDKSPLYVIDGEELPLGKEASLEILRKMNPQDIATMEVFKGEKAIKKYGEKGKNGVILIKTKKGKKKKSDTSENWVKDKEEQQPQNFSLHLPNTPIYLKDNYFLFVIDGEIVEQSVLKKLNPNDIQSMNVLKGESAKAIYGEKGAEGVLIINTKSKKEAERLYIVDGNEVSREEADSPEIFKNIVKIETIGKEEAMKRYGNKGKNGASIIHTTKTMSKPKSEDIPKGIRVMEFEPMEKSEEVKIYPNPTQQSVNIRFMLEKEEPVWIEVYDIKGQKVATVTDGAYLDKGQNSFLWDTKNISSGVYIITIKRDNKTSQHKIVIE